MQELIIFKKSYDFSKWLLDHTNKFPKSHRFSIAVKLENAILDFLRLITIANNRQKKITLLRAADEELLSMRIFLRLSQDLRFIPLSSYEYGIKQLEEIMHSLQSWLGHAKQANTRTLRGKLLRKARF